MKKVMLLVTASLVAFYSGQVFAGAACPNNKGKHAKTNTPSVNKSRVIAALKLDNKSPAPKTTSSKKIR